MDFVFWPASVRTYGFREHLIAAHAGGFTHLAIDPITYRRARAAGLSGKEMVGMADDLGLVISHLDTVTDWAPIRVPGEVNEALRERFDVSADECFEIAEDLGLTDMLAVAGYDVGTVPHPVLVEGFGALCDRAHAAGIWVDLEFMPFWGLPNLEDAWAIVRDADRSNSGILIDTWHFPRGKLDLDLLRAIPDRFIASSQVSDATKEIRGSSLFEDTVRYRKFAGEGELPVREILEILLAKGLRNVGPEVFSDEADRMTPEASGKRAGATLRATLLAAGARLKPDDLTT